MPDPIPTELRERAFRFTCDVFDFCEDLSRVPGMARRVAYQLFDSASSIGANLEEARAAYSRRDFTAKNSISLKESREAKYWLKVANAKALGDPVKRRKLLQEADEFVAMLTKGVKRLQAERQP
jgi:four helix bundle protein